MIPQVPSCAFVSHPLCGTGYNSNSEVQGHLQTCSISSQSHLAVPWNCSHQKGGFGAASTAFWFCSACSRSAHCSLHLFCPQSGRACARLCVCVCVCVCVCTRTSARWGNHRLASCQLRDGLQTILHVCSGWTNKHFRGAI